MILHHNNKEITSSLSLIYEVTKSINNNSDLNDIFESIYSLLKGAIGLEDICLWLWNDENKNFKLIFNKHKKIQDNFIDLLNFQCPNDGQPPTQNLALVHFEEDFVTLDNLKDSPIEIIPEKAKLFLPLIDGNNLLGVIVFDRPLTLGRVLTSDNVMMFNIIATQLATAILSERHEKRIKLDASISSATKDIAKIIETQYETNFVIPLMGEILDKYLSKALIYIFLRGEKDNLKISWPASYSEKIIDPLLDSLKKKMDVVFSDNRYAMALPLLYKNQLIGAIVGDAKIEEMDDIEICFLKELSKQCSVTLDRANAYAETVKHATVDALTGMDNRRQLDKRLMQEASIVLRTKRPLSVLMIDIDHFKMINDTHGHSVGDFVLKEIGKIIKITARDYDIVGRYGGEEFVVLLPDTTIEGAKILAERLRMNVEEASFNIGKYLSSKADLIKLTLSIGIATFDVSTTSYKNPADVYEEADIALYKAKQEGRNRVILFNYD